MTDESSPDQQHLENEVAQRRACEAISPRAARYFATPEECRAFEAWDRGTLVDDGSGDTGLGKERYE